MDDLIISKRKFPGNVITFANRLIVTQTTHNRLCNIAHIDGLLQMIPVAEKRDNWRVTHKPDQPPHVAVAGTAVDHGWAQDGVLQSACLDSAFGREADLLAFGVQLREDGGRADED